MPTLRSINNMQLKIQRTGTLQIYNFFFLLFCFLKRTDTRNKRYLRFHIAITVTGVPFFRGINAFFFSWKHSVHCNLRDDEGAFLFLLVQRGFPGRVPCSLRDRCQALIIVSTGIQAFTSKHSQDLICEGSLNDSASYRTLLLCKLRGQLFLFIHKRSCCMGSHQRSQAHLLKKLIKFKIR